MIDCGFIGNQAEGAEPSPGSTRGGRASEVRPGMSSTGISELLWNLQSDSKLLPAQTSNNLPKYHTLPTLRKE